MSVRRLLVIVTVLVVSWGVLMLAWLAHLSVEEAEREQQQAERPGVPQQDVGVTIRNQRIEASQEGRPLWSLRFEQIELGRGGQLVSASGLREGVIYDERTGKPTVRLTAATARYNTATRNFELERNVRVTDDKGLVLTMEKAAYVEAERKIECSGTVTARGQDITVTTELAYFWPQEDIVECPKIVRVATKQGGVFSGRKLRLNIETKDLEMSEVSGRFPLEEAKRRLGAG
ncbi:MAG: hypothetical protein ACE5R4_18420 [Armatimonadota bacterium]